MSVVRPPPARRLCPVAGAIVIAQLPKTRSAAARAVRPRPGPQRAIQRTRSGARSTGRGGSARSRRRGEAPAGPGYGRKKPPGKGGGGGRMPQGGSPLAPEGRAFSRRRGGVSVKQTADGITAEAAENVELGTRHG